MKMLFCLLCTALLCLQTPTLCAQDSIDTAQQETAVTPTVKQNSPPPPQPKVDIKTDSVTTLNGKIISALYLNSKYKVKGNGVPMQKPLYVFINGVRFDTLKVIAGQGYYFKMRNFDLDTKERLSDILSNVESDDVVNLSIAEIGQKPIYEKFIKIEFRQYKDKFASALYYFALLAIIFITGWILYRNNTQVLRDSAAVKEDGTDHKNLPPYSLARTQMAFWTVIILISILYVWYEKGYLPEVTNQVLILLGISAGTTVTASVIDNSDLANKKIKKRHQTENDSQNFFLNIISDQKGVSIHRFQNVIFSVAIGLYFLFEVVKNNRIPTLDQNLMVLMGISSGTYLAIKKGENLAYQDQELEAEEMAKESEKPSEEDINNG